MIIATAHHQLKRVANEEPAEGRLTLRLRCAWTLWGNGAIADAAR